MFCLWFLYELLRLFRNFNLYLVICPRVYILSLNFLCLVCLGDRDILATACNFNGSLVVDRFTVVFLHCLSTFIRLPWSLELFLSLCLVIRLSTVISLHLCLYLTHSQCEVCVLCLRNFLLRCVLYFYDSHY